MIQGIKVRLTTDELRGYFADRIKEIEVKAAKYDEAKTAPALVEKRLLLERAEYVRLLSKHLPNDETFELAAGNDLRVILLPET